MECRRLGGIDHRSKSHLVRPITEPTSISLAGSCAKYCLSSIGVLCVLGSIWQTWVRETFLPTSSSHGAFLDYLDAFPDVAAWSLNSWSTRNTDYIDTGCSCPLLRTSWWLGLRDINGMVLSSVPCGSVPTPNARDWSDTTGMHINVAQTRSQLLHTHVCNPDLHLPVLGRALDLTRGWLSRSGNLDAYPPCWGSP